RVADRHTRSLPGAAHRLAAADLRLRFASATIFTRYDEGTAQAQGLVDDRDRRSGDPVHFLFRATAGLRRDALRSFCSNVRPKYFDARSAANRAAPESGAGARHV